MAKVAESGKLALLGRRGRRFKSCHPDQDPHARNGALHVSSLSARSSVPALSFGSLAALTLPFLGRPAALLAPLALLTSVILVVRPASSGWFRAGVATIVGIGPAVVTLGVVADLTPRTIPAPAAALLLLAAWTVASGSLGVEIAARLTTRERVTDVMLRLGSVALVTGSMAAALLRLSLPQHGTAVRLAWIIGEEDNAQFVGIAREVLVDGPRGANLAEQYGTAFINLPLTLIGILGGPLATEPDVRLQAVTVFLASTVVAILLTGLAIGLLLALPQHTQMEGPASTRRNGGTGTIVSLVGAIGAGVVTLIGFSLVVVLPMRTGFLTFVWGLSIVLLSAALVATTPPDSSTAARAVLLTHLVGSGVLLLSTWPFIGTALVPLFLVLFLWIRWTALLRVIQERPVLTFGVVGGAVVLLSLAVWSFLQWGPAAEVLSYGVELLTVGGSGIFADRAVTRSAIFAALVTVAAITLGLRGRTRNALLIGFAGPLLGAGLLYLGIRLAASLLTGGELAYAGVKLAYGVIALAIVLGLTGVSSYSARLGTPSVVLVLVLVVGLHQVSATASLHSDWWSRNFQPESPHAQAAIEAIRATSVDLPIRCLPSPGALVTDRTRWSAYFCALWMEDAFNEGRFNGRRFDLLNAPGPTFEETISRIESENQSEYLFAYRMTMGRGWFGWDGSAN